MTKDNNQPSVYVPTREEFDEYVHSSMKLDDKVWENAIWDLATKVGWRKKMAMPLIIGTH